MEPQQTLIVLESQPFPARFWARSRALNLKPDNTCGEYMFHERTVRIRALTSNGEMGRAVARAGTHVKERVPHSGRVAGPAQPHVYIFIHWWTVAGGIRRTTAQATVLRQGVAVLQLDSDSMGMLSG